MAGGGISWSGAEQEIAHGGIGCVSRREGFVRWRWAKKFYVGRMTRLWFGQFKKRQLGAQLHSVGPVAVFADRPYVLGVFSYSALSYMKQYAMPLIVAMAREGKLHTNNRIAFTIP